MASDPKHHHFVMAWDGSVVSVLFNTGRAPMNDVNVRRAFALAVDNAAVAKLSSNKLPIVEPTAGPAGLSGKVYTGWINPQYATPRTQNPTAAKQALQTAGYTVEGGALVKGGKRYTVKYVAPSDTPFLKTIAELVVEQLKQSLGLRVRLAGGPSANTGPAIDKGDFDLAANWLSSGGGIYTALKQFDGRQAEALVGRRPPTIRSASRTPPSTSC